MDIFPYQTQNKHPMKRIFLASVIFFAATSFTYLSAQCNLLIELSKEAFEARDYQLAIERLLDTRDNCPGEKEVVNGLITKAFEQIEEEKNTVDRVLDQMYFYEEKFGLTLKEVGNEYYYGFIDKKGNEVIPFEFNEATPFSRYDGFSRVKKGNTKYLLDTTGTTYLLAENLDELTFKTEALNLSKEFPENIGDYQNLKILMAYDLDKGSRLKELPSSFFRLYKLKHVNLSGNQLGQLPKEIGNLKQLEVLNLHSNQLTQLPESIAKLTQLQVLDLEDNLLTGLPKGIGNLYQLKFLDLGFNE